MLTFSQVLKSRLFVDKFSESTQHTFLDYIAGGSELNFMVAIDYTGINSFAFTKYEVLYYQSKFSSNSLPYSILCFTHRKLSIVVTLLYTVIFLVFKI